MSFICWVLLIIVCSGKRNDLTGYGGVDACWQNSDLLIISLKKTDAVTSAADRWSRCRCGRGLWTSSSQVGYHCRGPHSPPLAGFLPNNCKHKKSILNITQWWTVTKCISLQSLDTSTSLQFREKCCKYLSH